MAIAGWRQAVAPVESKGPWRPDQFRGEAMAEVGTPTVDEIVGQVRREIERKLARGEYPDDLVTQLQASRELELFPVDMRGSDLILAGGDFRIELFRPITTRKRFLSGGVRAIKTLERRLLAWWLDDLMEQISTVIRASFAMRREHLERVERLEAKVRDLEERLTESSPGPSRRA